MELLREVYWTISQSVSWILFGDPNVILPDKGKSAEDIAFAGFIAEADSQPPPYIEGPAQSEVSRIGKQVRNSSEQDAVLFFSDGFMRSYQKEVLKQAEAKLIGDLQASRIVALGRPQEKFCLKKPKSALHAGIPNRELLGEVIINGPMCPSKWLLARFGSDNGADKIWYDVLIPTEPLKRLYPKPLIKLKEGSDDQSVSAVDHDPQVDRDGITYTPDDSTGAPGRPSKSMNLIEDEFNRRKEQGTVLPGLQHEADALVAWLRSAYPNKPSPTPKTVTNRIRPSYRNYQSKCPK